MATRAFSISELLNANFKYRETGGNWQKHIGHLQHNATILVMGPPKNGKSDYCMKLVKDLAINKSRVFYNSFEEGKSSTLQENAIRNNMEDVIGMVQFGNREPFAELMARMKKPRSASVLVIDSWDYMHLTEKDFQTMRTELKNKMIIIICWAHGARPDNQQARKIEHHADVLVHVRNLAASSVSRFGGNERMKFGERKVGQGELFG